MSGPTITMGPTMANPEAMNTVAELRQELHRANEQLLRFSERLHGVSTTAQQLGEVLVELLMMHMRGDGTALDARMTQLVDRHVRMASKPPGGVH